MGLDDLHSALAEVVAETAQHVATPLRTQSRPRAGAAGVIHLDDEDHRLPPVRRASRPAASVAEALHDSGAAGLVPVWHAVRETLTVAALFWTCAIVLALAADTQDLAAPLAAAVVARGMWWLGAHAR